VAVRVGRHVIPVLKDAVSRVSCQFVLVRTRAYCSQARAFLRGEGRGSFFLETSWRKSGLQTAATYEVTHHVSTGRRRDASEEHSNSWMEREDVPVKQEEAAEAPARNPGKARPRDSWKGPLRGSGNGSFAGAETGSGNKDVGKYRTGVRESDLEAARAEFVEQILGSAANGSFNAGRFGGTIENQGGCGGLNANSDSGSPGCGAVGTTAAGGGGGEGARDAVMQSVLATLPASLSQKHHEVAMNATCQVDGCEQRLCMLKEYHQRYRVCADHLKCDHIVKDGIRQRFCQQCGKFQDLELFDDDKRSCRERLKKHNERRRKRLDARYAAAMMLLKSAGAGDGAVHQSFVDPSSQDPSSQDPSSQDPMWPPAVHIGGDGDLNSSMEMITDLVSYMMAVRSQGTDTESDLEKDPVSATCAKMVNKTLDTNFRPKCTPNVKVMVRIIGGRRRRDDTRRRSPCASLRFVRQGLLLHNFAGALGYDVSSMVLTPHRDGVGRVAAWPSDAAGPRVGDIPADMMYPPPGFPPPGFPLYGFHGPNPGYYGAPGPAGPVGPGPSSQPMPWHRGHPGHAGQFRPPGAMDGGFFGRHEAQAKRAKDGDGLERQASQGAAGVALLNFLKGFGSAEKR